MAEKCNVWWCEQEKWEGSQRFCAYHSKEADEPAWTDAEDGSVGEWRPDDTPFMKNGCYFTEGNTLTKIREKKPVHPSHRRSLLKKLRLFQAGSFFHCAELLNDTWPGDVMLFWYHGQNPEKSK